MPARVYSRRFIARKGLIGDSTVIVPIDRVYVIRNVTVYAHTSFDSISVVFKDFDADVVYLFDHFNPLDRRSTTFDVHFPFEGGTTFGFAADASFGSEGVDCTAGGFSLVALTP